MTPEEVNKFYLVVGAERRNDSRRGDRSRRLKRKVMGRKGVGKLAPLGICERIEIVTSGGLEEKQGKVKGFRTAHIVLTRSNMMADSDEPYLPEVGPHDNNLSPKTGTSIRMTRFDHRRVPVLDDFDRQLAQRFGVESADWKIVLKDSQKTAAAHGAACAVGSFTVEVRDGTRVEFREELTAKGKSYDPPKHSAFGPDGHIRTDLSAAVEYEGGEYPVTGWVGYSKKPYKDDLMAGVRIYCRGKIAAQTLIFNMRAGFTGEYDIRSYLVGVLSADWLDEDEDLIRTDRQDILWSHPLGRAFEQWGQKLVKAVGTLTREPMRKQAWETFREKTKIDERVGKAFPAADQKDIRERTMEIAKTIAKAARTDELEDDVQCRALLELAMLLGPHISLEKKLLEAADSKDRPLEVVTDILRTARVAELSSFGRIADERVRVIKTVEDLKDDESTLEDAFQNLIEQAPWLINPAVVPDHREPDADDFEEGVCEVLQAGDRDRHCPFLVRLVGQQKAAGLRPYEPGPGHRDHRDQEAEAPSTERRDGPDRQIPRRNGGVSDQKGARGVPQSVQGVPHHPRVRRDRPDEFPETGMRGHEEGG